MSRWFVALLTLCYLAQASAQEFESVPDEIPLVDWYYASAFGTGQYRAGERKVSILRIPIAWNLNTESARWQLRFLLPVTLGAVDFTFDDLVDKPLDTVALATITPGVELMTDVGDHWRLRTFATLGGGVEFDGDDRAWIYSVGVSGRRSLACEAWRCTLGLSATGAGYNARLGEQDAMSSLAVGFDLITPVSRAFLGRDLRPGIFALYRNYLSGFDFIINPTGIEPVTREWEFGVSLNFDRPFKIFGYTFNRVGISYRRGGELRGLHFVSRFPF